MGKKEQLISRILEAEWDLFHNVPNVGGPASCQNDRETFEINRTSQAMSWSEATLESYLDDLLEARKQGRNLMTEKYARMMQSTRPAEYASIAPLLPQLAPEIPPLVEEILGIEVKWQKALLEKYPHVIKKGRPLHSSEDTPYQTSFETYLRGELSTYSLRTLKIYREHVLEQQSQNINGGEITLEHVVKIYGYASAKQANEFMGNKAAC